MFLAPLLAIRRPSRPVRSALKPCGHPRRPLRLEQFEERVVPAAPVNYTNLDVTGDVVVNGPVHDVKIEFDPTAPANLVLLGDAHDVTVVGDIPAGDTLTLLGNVHDIKAGNVAGNLNLGGTAHDVTVKDIHGGGDVMLGGGGPVSPMATTTRVANPIVHDVKTGNVDGSLQVIGNANDVTVKNIDMGGAVFIGGPFNTVHDVKVGKIAGLLSLAASAHDLTTGDIDASGHVTIGRPMVASPMNTGAPPVFIGSLHDFKTGNIAGTFSVTDNFHDGHVGTINGPYGAVFISATDFHKFDTESHAGMGFDHGTPDTDTTSEGGQLILTHGPANENKVTFEH
jgi:hypothetical protein